MQETNRALKIRAQPRVGLNTGLLAAREARAR